MLWQRELEKDQEIEGLQRGGTRGGNRAGIWSCAVPLSYGSIGLCYEVSLLVCLSSPFLEKQSEELLH